MNKILQIICFTIIISLVSSCHEGMRVKSNSYIRGYYELQSIKLSTSMITLPNGVTYHDIRVDNGEINWLSNVFHNYLNDNGMFEQYSEIHNDTSYPDVIYYSPSNSYRICYPASDFIEINVTCEGAWDESHSSGSRLNDITEFVARSIGPYIQNGYIEYDYTNKTQSDFFTAIYPFNEKSGLRIEYPVQKKLSEITKDDIMLLGDGESDSIYPQICDLFIPKKETSQPCQITVSMTNTEGTIFTDTVSIE